MPDNNIKINIQDIKKELQDVLAQIQQIQQATGGGAMSGMAKGAVAGLASRYANLNTQLSNLQGSASVGGVSIGGAGAAAVSSGAALSGHQGGAYSAGGGALMPTTVMPTGGGMGAAGAIQSWGFAPSLGAQMGPSSNLYNQFAGMAPMGPAMQIGTPGFQANAFYFQQQQSRASAFGGFYRGIAASAALTFTAALGIQANNIISGQLDTMGQAGALAGFPAAATAGSIAFGASILAGHPDLALQNALSVAAGVYPIAAASAQRAMAPYVRTQNAVMQIASVAARFGADPYSLVNAASGGLRNPGSFESLTDSINSRLGFGARALIATGLYTGTDYVSVPRLAEAYSTLGSAFLAAGDPRLQADVGLQNLAERRRLLAPQFAQLAAPVIAGRYRAGLNNADLLLQYGPEAYGAYQDVMGGADITSRQRGRLSDIMQAQYVGERAQFQLRGSGAAVASLLGAEMGAIEGLPGGRESLAFARAGAQQRAARDVGWSQQDIMTTGLPLLQTQGMLQRLQYMPYYPTNVLGLSLRQAGLASQQIQTINRRIAGGNLTEAERYGLEAERQQYANLAAQGIGMLSEGFENRIIATSSGAPAFFSRMNSFQGAAFNLGRRGSPIRAYGAVGGSQIREQNAIFEGTGIPSGPRSQTQDYNNMGEVVGILSQILAAIQGSGRAGAGERPAAIDGTVGARIQPHKLGSSSPYPSTP